MTSADRADWFVACTAVKMMHGHFKQCGQVKLLNNEGVVVEFCDDRLRIFGLFCAELKSVTLWGTTQQISQWRLGYRMCSYGILSVLRGNTIGDFDFGKY